MSFFSFLAVLGIELKASHDEIFYIFFFLIKSSKHAMYHTLSTFQVFNATYEWW
jgi:hypothetical protein